MHVLAVGTPHIHIISSIAEEHHSALLGKMFAGDVHIRSGGLLYYLNLASSIIPFEVDMDTAVITSNNSLANVFIHDLDQIGGKVIKVKSSIKTRITNIMYKEGKLQRIIENRSDKHSFSQSDIRAVDGLDWSKYHVVCIEQGTPHDVMQFITEKSKEYHFKIWIVSDDILEDGPDILHRAHSVFVSEYTPTLDKYPNTLFFREQSTLTMEVRKNKKLLSSQESLLNSGHSGAQDVLSFKMMGGRELFLSLLMFRLFDSHKWSASLKDIVEEVDKAAQLSSELYIKVLESQNKSASLEDMVSKVEYFSYKDPLTNLYNRRYVDILDSDKNMSVIFVDADNFKKINDELGHPAGDQALRIISETLNKSLRKNDVIVRWGGEEFVCILPDTDLEYAVEAAKRFLNNLHNSPFVWRLTASIGVAHGEGKSIELLIEEADQHMYTAKTNGKDRVCTPNGLI